MRHERKRLQRKGDEQRNINDLSEKKEWRERKKRNGGKRGRGWEKKEDTSDRKNEEGRS